MSGIAASLHCHQAGSDKVYNVALVEVTREGVERVGGGWFLLHAEYGRRGGSLNRADKIATPTPFAKAKKEFDKLVASKIAKGYEHTSGAAHQSAAPTTQHPQAVQRARMVPQLLNVVDEATLENLLVDDEYVMQQKFDGIRLMLDHQPGSTPHGINKRGMARALPSVIADAVEALPYTCLMDGELVGDRYYVFDLVHADGKDLMGSAYLERKAALNALSLNLPISHAGHFPPVPTASGETYKRRMLADLRASGAEGVVLRRRGATYSEGRTASGDDVLKFKFCESATVRVSSKSTGKRSVGLEMLDGNGDWVAVGNVTVPSNAGRIPSVGQFIEVRYLYAYPNGGCLFQPVLLGIRDDVSDADCRMEQLKFKADADAVAA